MDAWTCRSAALAAAERMAHATADSGELAVLAAPTARLHETLRSRWPDLIDSLPDWPAL